MKKTTTRTRRRSSTKLPQQLGPSSQPNTTPLLLESPEGRFPCDSLPLVRAVCGCTPAGMVINAVWALQACPLGMPFGCPKRRTPVL